MSYVNHAAIAALSTAELEAMIDDVELGGGAMPTEQYDAILAELERRRLEAPR